MNTINQSHFTNDSFNKLDCGIMQLADSFSVSIWDEVFLLL